MSKISKFIDKPLDQYVMVYKDSTMTNARTTYQCPLCKLPFSKREFENHVYKVHSARAEEAFAMLYGLSYPVRCTCGKELRYSSTHKGFPRTCGSCQTGTSEVVQYQNADEAHKHIEQLQAMLENAKVEEKRLKAEAELSRKTVKDFPFPSYKYNNFMKKLSMEIRINAVQMDKAKLLELANWIDSSVKEQ